MFGAICQNNQNYPGKSAQRCGDSHQAVDDQVAVRIGDQTDRNRDLFPSSQGHFDGEVFCESDVPVKFLIMGTQKFRRISKIK